MIAAVTAPRVDWYSIAPVVMPVAAAILIILFRSVARERIRTYEPSLVIGALGLAASAFFLAKQWSVVIDHGPADAMAHMIAVDGFSVFVGTVVVVSGLLTLLLSSDYLPRRGIESRPEYVALLLFSVAGMLTMASANDLIVVFVALEVLSIPLYVLAAYDRRRARSLEAGHQVLRARGVLLGDLPLRRRARCTAAPGPRRSPASRTSSPRTCSPTRARCSPAWRCCWWDSGSRSPRFPSTCGRPTSTRAHRAR